MCHLAGHVYRTQRVYVAGCAAHNAAQPDRIFADSQPPGPGRRLDGLCALRNYSNFLNLEHAAHTHKFST